MKMRSSVFFLLILYLRKDHYRAAAENFQVSLELQWEHCSNQLTLICTHNISTAPPTWVHNGTSAHGVLIQNIPGAKYTKSTLTRHVAVISGMENVSAVDGFTFQCVIHRLNNMQARSDEELYYWGYAEENSYVGYGNSSCYYNCTVDLSMAPQCHNYANISVTSSPSTTNRSVSTPKGVNYTISDLQRCQRYIVEVTAQVGAHKYTNQTEDTVTLAPGGVEIMNVTLLVRKQEPQLTVSLMKIESDCSGHETEKYTFFIDEVEVGKMTDKEFNSSFNRRGSTANFTLMIPEKVRDSGVVTVMLSNTVSFLENTTSSSNGVNSTLRNNTWTTKSAPYCLKDCITSPTNPNTGGDNHAVVIPSAIVLLLIGIVCTVVVAIVCWKKRCLQCHTRDIKCAHDIQRESSDTTAVDTANSALRGGGSAVTASNSTTVNVSHLEESNAGDSNICPVDATITTSPEEAALEDKDETILDATSDTGNVVASALQETAAGHHTVYAIIDHTKKGPTRAPRVEQFTVQYACLHSGDL